jgi:hypothetical protein
VVEEDSTAAVAADFMEAVEQRFTGVGVSAPEAALRPWADTPTPDIEAATMQDAATTEVTAVTTEGVTTAGAEDIGAEDTVTDGAGELGLVGRIGVGAGDIRMATTTVRGITRRDLIIHIRTTVLRGIPRVILILATGATILHRQIPARGPCPTRTGLQDPGDHLYREAHPTRATQPVPPPLRRVGRFSPLTG